MPPRPLPSDSDLESLYRTHGDALMALAYRLTGSTADAEDVLHDVFLGLPEALRRYEERGSLLAWLRRVTVRVALTRMRGESRRREIGLEDTPEPGRESEDASRARSTDSARTWSDCHDDLPAPDRHRAQAVCRR